MSKTLKEIAVFLNGELSGNGEVAITGINSVQEAGPGDIAFIAHSSDEKFIDSSGASCIVIPKDVKKAFNKPLIKVDQPSYALSKVIEFVMPCNIPHPKGIHDTAVIAKTAAIGKNTSIGAYTVIAEDSTIGDNTVVYPFCYVGRKSKIGDNCVLYPHVTVREKITIGNRVIIHPSTVIGSDGFGYDTLRDGSHFKIPQLGTVLIEDDVEIGSCVTIDRARFSRTVVGKGSKIDNLVQIAHNVVIGPYCLIAGQSGISGSSTLGRNVVFGGQVGVADHVKLGDFVIAGAKTGISKSYPAKTVLFGYPAKQVDKAREMIASAALLPKLFERVRALENKIKELEKK